MGHCPIRACHDSDRRVLKRRSHGSEVGLIYSDIAIVHDPDRMAGVLSKDGQCTDFSVWQIRGSDEQARGNLRVLILNTAHGRYDRITLVVNPEKNLKNRIVLPDL